MDRYWKSLSCILEKASQSYTEKRRRRKVAKVARRINGGNEKEGDRSSQFPKCSLSVLHRLEYTEIHRVG